MSNWLFYGAILFTNLNIFDKSKFAKHRGEIVQYKKGDSNELEYFQNYIYPNNYVYPKNKPSPNHHYIHFCDGYNMNRNFTAYNSTIKTCTDNHAMIYTSLCNVIYRLNIDFDRYSYLKIGKTDYLNPVFIYASHGVHEYKISDEFTIINNKYEIGTIDEYSLFYVKRIK